MLYSDTCRINSVYQKCSYMTVCIFLGKGNSNDIAKLLDFLSAK